MTCCFIAKEHYKDFTANLSLHATQKNILVTLQR